MVTNDDQLTHFSRAVYQIIEKLKLLEMQSFQESLVCEEYLAVSQISPIRTKRPSVSEPGNNGSHALVGQVRNDGSSYNSR